MNFETNIAAQSCGHICCPTLRIDTDGGAADFKTQTIDASITVLWYDMFPLTVLLTRIFTSQSSKFPTILFSLSRSNVSVWR